MISFSAIGQRPRYLGHQYFKALKGRNKDKFFLHGQCYNLLNNKPLQFGPGKSTHKYQEDTG